MSVLIKGMEMPPSCEKCRFSGFGGLRNERVVCMFTGANAYMNEVQYLDDCPLIPVPPHGRLIDADALAHDLEFDIENDQRALDQMDFVGKERALIQFDKDCKQNCMWYLSEASTIIPAEEES